jgi:hypothetical protein
MQGRHKLRQNAATCSKTLIGRTGIDGRLLCYIISRNIERTEPKRIDKFTTKYESPDTDMLGDKEEAENICTETEIVTRDQH